MVRSMRIAVADDEEDILEYFRKILPRLGHEVVVAARNGQELLEQCRLQHPDLVISDIKMPDLDGIEATAELCRQAPLPVILVSACREPDSARRAKTDHVVGHLVKPVRQANLESAIASAVTRFEQAHPDLALAEDSTAQPAGPKK
jgi:CheY-like chemotaxis protein